MVMVMGHIGMDIFIFLGCMVMAIFLGRMVMGRMGMGCMVMGCMGYGP